MKKLERGIMNVTGCFLAALMFLMMVDIFAAVLVRYVFHTALNFSEELGRYVFDGLFLSVWPDALPQISMLP